jgi:hypothetical protein
VTLVVFFKLLFFAVGRFSTFIGVPSVLAYSASDIHGLKGIAGTDAALHAL